MADRRADLVLFDLGGVLIELGGVPAMGEMAGISTDDAVWQRWLTSPWVRRFESGGCSAAEFSRGVVTEWGLAVPPERFLELFRAWPIGPLPGSSELLAETRRAVPIGCLSNTNAVHWEEQARRWPLLGMFDYRFLSFDLGQVKPDAAIFETVVDRLPVDHRRILFLDDNALNTEAARSFGFMAEQVSGPADARQALVDHGVLSGVTPSDH